MTSFATSLHELKAFANQPVRTFTTPDERASMEAALAKVRAGSGKRFAPVIDGAEVIGAGGRIVSRNPARPDEVVGMVDACSAEQATRAVEAASQRFEIWKQTTVEERAGYLLAAAEHIRRRRDEFNAVLVYEVGKTWIEADAETAEAIDFLEFYAREALRYANPLALTPLPGEENHLIYVPLGVGVVIPPWNFAFAIMTGMVSAALVCGNTVCLKPSEDASVIAALFVDLLAEVGLPPGVLNFVPGPGAIVGEALVTHPLTRFIAFTGSKSVGLHINETAASVQSGQRWIKRVIAEMGGKDAIIVASDADLQAAVKGVVSSAFGYQGQKCSSCSRVIAEAGVYDELLTKVVARTRDLRIGDPADSATDLGPVINQAAIDRILGYVEIGAREGRLVAGGRRLPGEGYFLEPTIIADVPSSARIAQEEIFGPFLAFLRVRDFSDALKVANDTEFGLTGAVYSRDAATLERARDEFHVGNLYFNRKCTGALVGVHPFGGFNMSGTDSKAGGSDYLLQFLQAKVVSSRRAPH
ncbi:MAG TPA: L-glutamate gamma-semialdehyde dehydrogenase [Candidatus Baltobacteraceae bacterium]|nr:L-glutamate gamma-semialdehyde dehydrogenase [Candidatus Baltobacteraceae bacterium]